MRFRIMSLAAALAVATTLSACGAPEPTPAPGGTTNQVMTGQPADPAAALQKQAATLAAVVNGQYADTRRGVTNVVTVEVVKDAIKVTFSELGSFPLESVTFDGIPGGMNMPAPNDKVVDLVAKNDPASFELSRVPGN